MAVTIRIPTPLRNATGGDGTIDVEAATVGEALEQLGVKYPAITERIFDDGGELRRFVNVYIDGEDIRFLKNSETPLEDGQEVSIVPAVAGG